MTKDTSGSESAFPVTYQDRDGQLSIYALGLTKREYIAIAAMQAILSNPGNEGITNVEVWAYKISDKNARRRR